jgi:hypothetical protein
MNGHKEYITFSAPNVKTKYYRCSLFTDSCSKSFYYIQLLADIAMSEFTDVTIHDIEVVTLGGNWVNGITAIEFVTTQQPNDEWTMKESLQPTK